MSASAIRDYAESKGFRQQTLERWLGWLPADRDLLAHIAISLKISENHLRDLMDWLEEISLRDRVPIHDILARPTIESIHTDPRLGRADKLKRIKEQVRRWRFPRLASLEEALRARLKALDLPKEIKISVPPGLEGSCLSVEFSAANAAEWQELTRRLAATADSESIAEIFELLTSRTGDAKAEEIVNEAS